MMQSYRCWVEIERAALRHNAKVGRARIGAAEMLAVVKANAYGHGALGVAEALAEDVQFFGVANLEEALALRQRVTQPIITLSPTLPDERAAVVQHAIIPTISSFEEAEGFAKQGRATGNLKVDCGKRRMGGWER